MSEKITFKELVELIAEQAQQSQSSANSFIHELVQIIESGLKQSGSVSISGFGKFELRWMNERQGVNPQTGEDITIPGQNKVVFKPYKALRETVNKPFAGLESELIPDETEETNDSGTNTTDSEDSEYLPTPENGGSADEDYIDDLLFERENPHFRETKAETAVLTKEKSVTGEETEKDKDQKIAPVLPDETKHVKEVQESGSMRWSYAAAVIIVMVAFIILFYLMQRGDENLEPGTADTTPDQTEQVAPPAPSTSEAQTEAGQEEVAENEPTVDEETTTTETETSGASQTELETESYTVESGQSLWDIAENELGNPYLWPVIYQLNSDVLSNPNQLVANSDITIPTFSDPENLTEFEREQVALGYFSLYEWSRENNPDEARYFLWAVGVFSPDLLDQTPSQVDSTDLAFARNR